MRSKLLYAVVAAALVLGVAECSKKRTSAEDPEALANVTPEAQAEASGESALRGWLEVKGAGLEGQEVRKAGTSEKVELVSATRSVVPLPSGTYDVVFGKNLWKGVVIVEGRTTSLQPGWVSVAHASLEGHEVVEEATGTVQGTVSSLRDTIALVPGRYVVMFGKLPWPVEVRAGETMVLRPGTVEVPYADASGHRIYDRSGAVVGEVSNIRSSIPLPPGEYEIELGGTRIPFSLREGDTRRFERD
ncbi:MAG TPA: hypothetical protein VHP61_03205 [Acidobacteriota bacterium]|nr:hypothetical protein [Acidobacteriota bacterium]